MGQATVLNLLLRSLLAEDQVEQAFKLVSQTTFPEKASNNQFCRYLYYTVAKRRMSRHSLCDFRIKRTNFCAK